MFQGGFNTTKIFYSLDVQKNIINFVKNKLYEITKNDILSAWIVFAIHIIFGASTLIMLIFGSVNNLFYIFSMILWILIGIMNIYFKGCIFTKIERKLWNNKSWYGGPWTVPIYLFKYLGLIINEEISNKIVLIFSFLLIVIVVCKLNKHIFPT